MEVLVSIIQHPQGASAPAPTKSSDERGDHPLGIIPHQIRGFLSNFQNVVIRGSSYDRCSACSDKIISAYTSDGWQFVKRALNERDYVEDLSGLTEVRSEEEMVVLITDINQVQKAAEKALADMEWSDEEGDAEEEGEGEML